MEKGSHILTKDDRFDVSVANILTCANPVKKLRVFGLDQVRLSTILCPHSGYLVASNCDSFSFTDKCNLREPVGGQSSLSLTAVVGAVPLSSICSPVVVDTAVPSVFTDFRTMLRLGVL